MNDCNKCQYFSGTYETCRKHLHPSDCHIELAERKTYEDYQKHRTYTKDTNADKLRNMSDYELEQFLQSIIECCRRNACESCVLSSKHTSGTYLCEIGGWLNAKQG